MNKGACTQTHLIPISNSLASEEYSMDSTVKYLDASL